MKKLLLIVSLVFVFSLLFTLVAFADDLKPSDSDAFGEVSTLDTPVGRTDLDCLNDDGTVARVVILNPADEKYYTFPSTYVMGTNAYANKLMVIDLKALSTALGATLNYNSIYRYEMPTSVTGTGKDAGQKFYGFGNLKELRLKIGSHHATNNCSSFFQDCVNLEVIHNLETMTIASGTPNLSGMYQSCKKLKTAVVFHGATSLGSKIFYECNSLEEIIFTSAPEGTEPVAITSIGNDAFRNTSSLTSFDIPDTVSSIGQQAFYGSGIKSVVIPSAYTYNSNNWNPFIYCASLEYADLSKATVETYPACFFKGCTSLKVVVLNDNVKTLGKLMFADCTNLEFLYLPTGITSLGVGDKWDQGAFYNCQSLYFVSEKYSLEDFVTDGKFDATKYAQNKPARPDIYLFPESIVDLNNVANPFRNCYNINPTIVFGENTTLLHKDGHTFGGMGANEAKNVVFLGNVTNFYYNNTYKNISFYLVGSKKSDVTISERHADNRNGKIYFCGESGYYDLYYAGNTAKWVETDTPAHIFKETSSSEATCTLPKMVADRCFCGAVIGEAEAEGAPLGHNYAGEVTYLFTSVTEPGKKCTVCVNNCGIDEEITLAPVYTALGISVSEFTTAPYSFSSGYNVNVESLELYEQEMGVSVTLGFAFNAADDFTDGEVTLDSFKLKTTVANQTVDYKFDRHDFVMSYATDEHLAKDVIIAAFVVEKTTEDETVRFINRDADSSVGVNGFEAYNYLDLLEKYGGK